MYTYVARVFMDIIIPTNLFALLLPNVAAVEVVAPFYERPEWWQGVLGNLFASAICLVIGWIAVKAARLLPTIRDNSGDATKFALEIAAMLFLGILAFRLGMSFLPSATTATPDLSEIKQTLKAMNDRDSGLFWQPIPDEAKESIREAMHDLGHLKFGVYRTDTSDCSMLAIQLAGLGEDAGWQLLAPPYKPVGGDAYGLVLLVPSDDPKYKALKKVLSEKLGVPVNQGPLRELQMAASDGSTADICLYVGVKQQTGFLQSGSQVIPQGTTTLRISLKAKLPYTVSGWDTWSGTFKVTETAEDHFTIVFDAPSPAPLRGPIPNEDPTLHWSAYHFGS